MVTGRQSFVPDLAFMALLGGQPIRPHERVRKSPGLAFELSERLGQPTSQGQVIEVAKRQSILLPELIQRCIGVECHRREDAGRARLCRAGARCNFRFDIAWVS